MNLKKNYHYLVVFFLFLIISFLLASYLDLNRHWSYNYDQEFTLIYNALLFNNGKSIEYVAHPGFFTILFLSLFFKLLFLFNFLTVDKLSLLSVENFDQSFQILIFYTRVYSTICIAVFCSSTYAIFYQFSKIKIYSYILSLLIFISFGLITHVAQLRTELIAMFFVILSMISLKIFFEKNTKYKIFYLAYFFLFLFCALLNKMQVFFFLPLLFLFFYFCENNIEDFNTREFSFLEKKWIPFILFFIILFYLYIENKTQHPFPALSTFAILFSLISMNLFFFLILKNNYKNIKINLVVINLCFILVFFLLKNFLSIHPSASPVIFSNLTRIMNLSMYMSNAPEINDTFSFISILFGNFWNNSSRILGDLIFKINGLIFLILLNIFITIIYRKSLTPKLIKFNIVCCFVALSIMLINSYRNNGNILFQYYIFSNLFLVLPFCSFSKFLKYRYLILILILVFFVNFQANIKYLNQNKISTEAFTNQKIKNLCKSSYFYDWQRQLKKEYYSNFCKKYLK